ncbi:MAG TPA: PQQ-binding-like beta-propeller repeat protein, partial [Vicinamibacteria bacterium]|nr:PQQ-binding-like beta-propeller repeat protein [Vicinamibacteria bacterium]
MSQPWRILVWLVVFLPAISQAQTGSVSYERLLGDETEPENWLTYSGGYFSHRYSRLDQIQASNVTRLRVEWVHQVETMQVLETNPIVADGIMYITEPPSDVVALDLRTGRPFWSYRHKLATTADKICCGPDNRGVALLDGRVYIGTIDARLVALDARSGGVLWDVEVANPESGYSITSAPLAIKDKIVTGIAGGEYGIRGFLDAYDAKTGKRAWRFYTIPAPGEPGNETWGNDSWRTGGSPTWVTGAFDPGLNLVYWGTGNPAPDWNGDLRPGDNLYSDSVVALDADSGELRWYFQFTPHDTHDWDACQTPILVDADWEGQRRRLMLWANRNGFYYVLDRETGEFLRAREFSKQTWAEGLDEHGRPIVLPGSDPTEEGTLVFPSCCATANWWPSSYSPRTGLYYAAAVDGGAVYYKGEDEYNEGDQ